MSAVAVLRSLTPVLVQGPDARKFMQGQLTNDVRKLTRERALLGSCNTGQGRVQAVVTLLERGEGVVGLFPSATLERMLAKLRASICAAPVPGTRVVRADQDVGELVDAVSTESGCDLLAVVSLDEVSASLALGGVDGSSLTPAHLPYEVPLARR